MKGLKKFKNYVSQNKILIYTIHLDVRKYIIHRNNFDHTLLRCVTQDEAHRILYEFHKGFFGGYYSGPTPTKNILQVGYYWPIVFQDSFKIAWENEKCSRYWEIEEKIPYI